MKAFPVLMKATVIDQAATTHACLAELKRKGMTTKKLAELAGCSGSLLSDIYQGRRSWTEDIAGKVGAVLNGDAK